MMTTTLWAVFQSEGVKTSDVVERLPSVASQLLTLIVTLADGRDASRTVNEAVAPASVVTRPVVGFTRTVAVSLSVFVRLTFESTMAP